MLPCVRERTNWSDPFAVAVKKNSTIVGHVPRKVSAVYSLFLRRNGSIQCRVTGQKRYSSDLPQGGLEIPCVYTFTGVSAQVNKVKKLLTDNATIPEAKNTTDTYGDDEIVKKRKIEHRDEWVSVGRIHLTTVDKEVVLNELELNDMILNASQQLLHQQFPPIKGLRSTLSPVTNLGAWVNNYLQIFHCRTNHWTTASTIGCHEGEVCVYDSLYTSVDDITKKSISDVFSLSTVNYTIPPIQKQEGSTDCGLFAIAIATYLAVGQDPHTLPLHHFVQKNLRPHLVSCLEQEHLIEFPIIN